MKRYEIIGMPLNPSAEIAGKKIGDEFTADLDKDVEKALIGEGVVRVMPEKKKTDAKGDK